MSGLRNCRTRRSHHPSAHPLSPHAQRIAQRSAKRHCSRFITCPTICSNQGRRIRHSKPGSCTNTTLLRSAQPAGTLSCLRPAPQAHLPSLPNLPNIWLYSSSLNTASFKEQRKYGKGHDPAEHAPTTVCMRKQMKLHRRHWAHEPSSPHRKVSPAQR